MLPRPVVLALLLISTGLHSDFFLVKLHVVFAPPPPVDAMSDEVLIIEFPIADGGFLAHAFCVDCFKLF